MVGSSCGPPSTGRISGYGEAVTGLEETPAPDQVLKRAGIHFQRFEHSPARTVDDLRAVTDFSIENSVKTLAFHVEEGRVVLAAIPGPARINYGALAKSLGVARSRLAGAGPEILAGLGMAPGGVCPIPTVGPEVVTIVFDNEVPVMGRVYCGGGGPDVTFALQAHDLVSLWPNPQFGAITRPAQ